MLVYRDDSRLVSAQSIRADLCTSRCATRSERVLHALLQAGELECALADLAHASAGAFVELTDRLAACLVRGEHDGAALQALAARATQCPLPDQLRLRTPEGYAYYALHPLDYADLARRVCGGPGPLGVIGVRSIGTSLGAVVRQALLEVGRPAERISVRPGGEPWARSLRLQAGERRFVERIRDAGGEFAVVDEGPGMSGSTLLAVCEALEAAGVARARIVILCSRRPDPARLLAAGAAERWRRYRSHAVAAPAARAGHELSAGAWRSFACGADRSRWPATFAQLERAKWLSPDLRWLDKFEGLGPYADAAFGRACALARARLAPRAERVDGGYVRYPWIAGPPLAREALDTDAIAQLARYCAFRREVFGVDAGRTAQEFLAESARVNVHKALGVDLGPRFTLELVTPVIADARMQPHEWRMRDDKHLLKLDGHADGDGHLLPGPTDVCWDLAGAVVEWHMDGSAQTALTAAYDRLTGDRVAKRLRAYIACYAVLRVGLLTFAEHAAAGDEAVHLHAARDLYLRRLRAVLAQVPGMRCSHAARP